MSLSDSMFLFEITIDELKSIFNYKDYSILGHFADVFHVYLKDVNDFETALSKKPKKKLTKKSKVRDIKNAKIATMSKVPITRSVLIAHDTEILKERMKNYPLELSFRSKYNPEVILASNQIPWSHNFIDFLNEIETKGLILPVIVENKYSLFHEYTSKRVATIKLSIKLSFLMDKLCTQIQYPYTSNFETTKVLSTINERCLTDGTGIIKTTCAGRKSKPKHTHGSQLPMKTYNSFLTNDKSEICHNEYIEFERNNKYRNKIISLVKSHTDIEIKTKPSIIKSQSCCSLEYTKPLNILNYIFGTNNGPFGNRVYCVGYFSIQNESVKKLASPKVSSKDNKSSESSTALKEKYHFSLCDAECPSKKACDYSCQSHCSLDLPKDAEHLISVKHCNRLDCDAAKSRQPPNAPDERLMVNLTSMKRDSCIISEKVEQVVGGMTAKMKMGPRPCYCSCECTFGFTKKTTYCNICGGVEKFGEEKSGSLAFPCPIYHKLVDKNKLKTVSSGSDSKKKGSKHTNPFGDKNDESEKDNKKGKTKNKDDRFKFNYGYTAPQIGHSQCAMPCKGTLGSVPKNMGWLWTAEDIPGMRFRPMWKPGAVNKYVVRLLRIAKNPDEAIAKKRKRELKKKPLKRPLLIVHKKDGEFTVTMETMKAYSKQRAINHQPYEEKPLVTYTIGRSEEENRERLKKKERIQRRLERAQRDFIQNTFKDICKEICLKTYQQALGILPDTEDPECVCYPAEPGPDKTNMNRSCSCSEDSASDSDTDSDEWVVEFTPPNAYFDPTYKGKKVLKVEKETQYTYLDYRVKLVDRYGNPVPRFFKGPDGKQQCSDLGGFWSPEHEWLEINVDGYIAPDNRWAPMSFTGPNGEQIDTEEGKFQAANGKWLVVGVDGYIDNHGKWRFYSRPRASPARKRIRAASKKVVNKPEVVQSETTWSCFGDASPKHLSKMGIIGHGIDRKLLAATLKEMLARGEDVTLPKPSVVPRLPDSKKRHSPRFHQTNYSEERTQCRHPVPSAKGVVAVNTYGNKTYFKLKDHKNKRPNERIATLNDQGISLSSFHVPCFHSFINNEIMKQEQQERIIALAGQSKSIATQA